MDMGLVVALTAIIFILLIFSAYFSMSEMTFSTVNTIKLKKLDSEGVSNAAKAISLTEDFDKFLTTVLVGNNLVNIAASTTCAMLFTEQLLPGNPGLATVLATIVMTLLILTFGEILPKTLAKRNAERYALKLVNSLSMFVTIFYPLSWAFVKMGNFLTKKEDEDAAPTLTEDELVVMINEIEEEGTLEKTESDLIKSAITFDDTKLSEVYIPRVDIVAVSKDVNMDELKDIFIHTGYSRIPVYHENIDRIVGVVNAKDFYRRYVENDNFNIIDIIRQVQFFDVSTNIDEVLNVMQRTKVHMAVVLDAFGGTLGIVTLEDLIEELVGEIWDESDDITLPVVREADGSYTVLGDANIFDVMEDLGLDFDPGEYQDYNVSGYIQYVTGKIPRRGAVIELDGVTVTVLSTKGRRVKDAKFELKPDAQNSEES
jgi:CBS domain containing-hemolysin-like protein